MKLNLLQEQLKKEKIDYLLLTNSDPNFTYLTGLKNLSFALLAVPQKGLPLLFLTSLDQEKTAKTVKSLLIKKPWETFIKKYLKPKSLAYNSQNLTLYSYKRFKKIFPSSKFRDFSLFLQQLRAEKTEKELFYLKKAAQLTDQAFQQIIKGLKNKKFKKENDLRFFLEKFAFDYNTALSFPPIIASAKNTRNPHHQPSNCRLRKGFLLIDFGLSYHHYCMDMTRMLYLGMPTKKELKIYNYLLNIQNSLIKNLKLNQLAGETDQQARKALGKYSSYFLHGLGHGLGIEIHELPSLKPESQDIFKRNQVFTIEPGIYLKNFGLRIEDTISMKSRPVILTKTPKNLFLIKA